MVETLEAGVAGRAWIAGDRLTAADVYLASQIGWGMHVGMLPRRPAFEAYFEPLWNRPAAIRARAIDDDLLAKAAADVGG
jgi:glutathione S-transferase